MNLYEITPELLAKQLQVEEVPEEFVILAKHQVLGFDNEQIAQTLAVDVLDIEEAEKDELFLRVKAFVGGIHGAASAQLASGWDAIEQIAMERLIPRIQKEQDSEFLLKVATLANRAQRRKVKDDNILDPGKMVGRTTITLTQRLVNKINERGERSQEEVRQVSFRDGTMGRADIKDVDSLLNVRNVPVVGDPMHVITRSADPTVEELTEEFMRIDRGR